MFVFRDKIKEISPYTTARLRRVTKELALDHNIIILECSLICFSRMVFPANTSRSPRTSELTLPCDAYVLSLSLPCLSALIRRFALHNLCDLNPTG